MNQSRCVNLTYTVTGCQGPACANTLRKQCPGVPLAEWQMLAKRLPRIASIRSAETLLTTSETPSDPTFRALPPRSPTESQLTHYLLMRMAGIAIEIAISESRAPSTHVAAIEDLLRIPIGDAFAFPWFDTPAEMVKSQLNWRLHLANKTGQELISAATRFHDIQMIATAIQLLDTKTRCNIHEDALLRTIRKLREGLSSDFTLNVLPSLNQSSPLLQKKIRAIDESASVKRSTKRYGSGYTLTLTAIDPVKRGPRPDGHASEIFRQALRARLALLTSQPTGR